MPMLRLRPEWTIGSAPQVANTTIPDNDRGNYQTVAFMQDVAHQKALDPVVRKLALSILSQAGIGSHNFVDEAFALANFVQQNVRYVRDPTGVEQIHDPTYLVQQIAAGSAQGDCDDQALLLASLLLTVGARPFFAIVRYNSNHGPYNHIYTVVYEKNWGALRRRIVLDTILKDRAVGFEVPFRSIKEIEV